MRPPCAPARTPLRRDRRRRPDRLVKPLRLPRQGPGLSPKKPHHHGAFTRSHGRRTVRLADLGAHGRGLRSTHARQARMPLSIMALHWSAMRRTCRKFSHRQATGTFRRPLPAPAIPNRPMSPCRRARSPRSARPSRPTPCRSTKLPAPPSLARRVALPSLQNWGFPARRSPRQAISRPLWCNTTELCRENTARRRKMPPQAADGWTIRASTSKPPVKSMNPAQAQSVRTMRRCD